MDDEVLQPQDLGPSAWAASQKASKAFDDALAKIDGAHPIAGTTPRFLVPAPSRLVFICMLTVADSFAIAKFRSS